MLACLYWPWLAGLTLLCFSVVISFTQLPTNQLKNTTLKRQIQALEAQLRAPLIPGAIGKPQELLAHLETSDTLPALANDLQALAGQNGLMLSDAMYKPLNEVAKSDIGRIEINVHLKGSYLPLKKMIAAMLILHEGLALESLSMRRNRSTEAAMEMDVRFTFFYRVSA